MNGNKYQIKEKRAKNKTKTWKEKDNRNISKGSYKYFSLRIQDQTTIRAKYVGATESQKDKDEKK